MAFNEMDVYLAVRDELAGHQGAVKLPESMKALQHKIILTSHIQATDRGGRGCPMKPLPIDCDYYGSCAGNVKMCVFTEPKQDN